MPVAKVKALNSTDVMKPEEGNDSLDTFIRQAIGKEPFLSFSRENDSPVQWIQLLHALDQQEFPGWPLLTPMKVQMQKCEKCSREFCSSINYRRHIRVHHRLKKLDKDSVKNRDLLREFWDKRSEDEMKEILSFKDVKLEDVTGSSMVKSLTSLLRKPVISSLPQYCLRAASALLEIIQARPSKFPLSSEELFGILDDASEKTFLSGSAVSMQKYIFDGEAGKIGLETKNLVACTSFLVERKLVKAWLTDKDAEALRCQKLLVEEEEAAQRRQAELLERKRQKKLRQKEQRAKEQREEIYEETDVKDRFDGMTEAVSLSELSCPLSASDSSNDDLNFSIDHGALHYELPSTDEDVDSELQTSSGGGYADQANDHFVERQNTQGNSHRHNVVSQWHPSKSQRNHLPNGFHSNQNSQAPKFSTTHKHGSQRDLKALTMVNGSRRWGRKFKAESAGETLTTGVYKEAVNQADHSKKHEVLIGSISVTLEKCNNQEDSNVDGLQGDYPTEHQILKKTNPQVKHNRPDSSHGGTNRSTVKLWRPVSRNGSKCILLTENGTRESQANVIADKAGDQTLSNDSCLRSCVLDGDYDSTLLEDELCLENLRFSSEAARAFLAERWKEAIAADHVTLVLSPNNEHPGGFARVSEGVEAKSSDSEKVAILGIADNNQLVNGASNESNLGIGRAKFKTKPEKGVKLKYIPKQRTIT